MAAVAPPVSPQIVGNAFVQQYYHILHQSPALVHQFYQDISKLGRPEDDGSMGITTTMTAINEKILSLNYDEFRAEIKSVDAQDSYNMGVHVLVTGYLNGKDNVARDFAQSFFLAPQDRGGYFVLNDMFRYLEKANQLSANHAPFNEVEVPVTVHQEAAPVQEDHITDQTDTSTVETSDEVAHNSSENGETKVAEEEEPVAEVVDQVPGEEVIKNMPNDSKLVVESNFKSEEVPKKSYASIVKDLMDRGLPFSTPGPVVHKTLQKSQEQKPNPDQPASLNTDVLASNIDAAENVNDQDTEPQGYSIYIKGLPYNATPTLLEDEFKKYGTIKSGGIQVRSKQGFCFGFVEYEEASAVQRAIEASPIPMGGRKAIVEEKKSTNSGGNNRGRFPAGRMPNFRNESGYRNEGMRGHGNYGVGRGYSRGEFSGKTELDNRGNYREGSTNGVNNGYQSTENFGSSGGRASRANAMPGSSNTKSTAPRVPATT